MVFPTLRLADIPPPEVMARTIMGVSTVRIPLQKLLENGYRPKEGAAGDHPHPTPGRRMGRISIGATEASIIIIDHAMVTAAAGVSGLFLKMPAFGVPTTSK